MISYPQIAGNDVHHERHVADKWTSFMEALCHGNEEIAIRKVLEISDVKEHAVSTVAKDVKRECASLCKTNTNSLFKQSSAESLANWSYENQELELNVTSPTFLTILQAAGTPKGVEKNKKKTHEVVRAGLMTAAGVILHTRNKFMNAHQMLTALILKQGGAGEKAFRRLSSRFLCVGLNTADRALDEMCVDYDLPVRNWAIELINDREEEGRIQQQLTTAVEKNDKKTAEEVRKKLNEHNEKRHPGFQLVGDNVDMRINVRQMGIGHQNLDLHHFNFLAIKNRVQIHHLPNDKPVCPPSAFEPGMVLPNVSDNKVLKRNWTTLIGHIIAENCPALSWFEDHLVAHIPHKYTKEAAKKTEAVSRHVSGHAVFGSKMF